MEEKSKKYPYKDETLLVALGFLYVGSKYYSRWKDPEKSNSVKDFILEDFLDFNQPLNKSKEKIKEIENGLFASKCSTVSKYDGVYFKIESEMFGNLEIKLNSNTPAFLGGLSVIPRRKGDSAISLEFFVRNNNNTKFSYFQDMIPKDADKPFSQREYKFKSKFTVS